MDEETEGREALRQRMILLQTVLKDTYSQLDRLEEELGDDHDPLEPPGVQRPQGGEGSSGSARTVAIMARHTLTSCLRLSRRVSQMRLTLAKKDIELEILNTSQRLADELEDDSSGDSSAQQDRTDEGLPTESINELAHPSSSSPASSSSDPPVEIGLVDEGHSPEDSRKQKASTSRITVAESSTAARLNMAGTSSGVQTEANNSKVGTLHLSTEEMPISDAENSRSVGDRMQSSHSIPSPSETIIPSTASPGKLQSQNVIPTQCVHAEAGKTSVDEGLQGATEPVKGDDKAGGNTLDPQETMVSLLAEDFSAFYVSEAGSTRQASPASDGPLSSKDETEDILSTDTISQVTTEREGGRQSETDISSGQERAVCNKQSMNTNTKTETDSLNVTNEAVAGDQNTGEHPRSLQRRTTDRSSQNKHSGEVFANTNSHSKDKASSPGNSNRDCEVDSPAANTRFKLFNVSLVSWKVERRKSLPAQSVKASTSGNRATEIISSDDSKSANRQNESFECSRGVSPLPIDKLSGNTHTSDSEARSLSAENKSAAFQNKPNSCQSTCRVQKGGGDSVSAETERKKTMEVPNVIQAGITKTSGEVLMDHNRSKPEKVSQGNSHSDCEMDSPATHTRFKFLNTSLMARKAVRKSVPAKSVDMKASKSSGNRATEISSSNDSESANRQTESYGRSKVITSPLIDKLSGKRQIPDLEARSISPQKKSQNKANSNMSTCKVQEGVVTSASAQTERNKKTEVAKITSTASVNEAASIQVGETETYGELSVNSKNDSSSENISANNHRDSEVDSPAAHTRFKFLNISLLSQKEQRKPSPALCVDVKGSTSSVKNAREIRSSGESKSAKTRTESFVCTRGAHRLSSEKKSSAFQNKTNSYRSTCKVQKRSIIFVDAETERDKKTEVPIITPTGKVKEVDSVLCADESGVTKNSGKALVDRNSRSKPEKMSSHTHHTDGEKDSPAAHTRFKFLNASLLARRAESKSVPAHSEEVTASTSGKRARETSSSDDDKSTQIQSESGIRSIGRKSRSKEKLSCKNLKPDSQFSTHFQKKSRRSFGSLLKGTNVRQVTSAACSSNVRATRGDSLSLRTRSKTGNYSDLRRKVNETKHCVSCSPPFNRSQSLGNRDESASLSTRSRRYRL